MENLAFRRFDDNLWLNKADQAEIA